jgi:hypothetical protein
MEGGERCRLLLLLLLLPTPLAEVIKEAWG